MSILNASTLDFQIVLSDPLAMSVGADTAVWDELGETGFKEITASFYKRVRKDSIIGPLYPEDDWEASERRLYLFFCFRFGEDPRYLEERGHPRLRARHLAFPIGVSERDRWLTLMEEALREHSVSPQTQSTLMSFFSQVADFMRNKEENSGSPSSKSLFNRGRGIDFGR